MEKKAKISWIEMITNVRIQCVKTHIFKLSLRISSEFFGKCAYLSFFLGVR